jgi:Mrp family chromosome partitioning ATPase
MIPRVGEFARQSRRIMRREAVRTLSLSAGLEGVQGIAPRVLLATSALPGSGSTACVNSLATAIAAEGRRTLILNLTPASHAGPGPSLDDAIADPNALADLLRAAEPADQERPSVVTLKRKCGLSGGANPYLAAGAASEKLSQLIDRAVEEFDAVLIETPPALLFLDAALMAGRADVTLFFAKWNATPPDAVSEAVMRLEEHGVRIDGVVLTQVDLDLYRQIVPNGRARYLREYQKTFEKMARA